MMENVDVMVNKYIFKGSNSATLIFASLLYGGDQLSKEKNLLPQEQILSFKERSNLEGLNHGEENGKL